MHTNGTGLPAPVPDNPERRLALEQLVWGLRAHEGMTYPAVVEAVNRTPLGPVTVALCRDLCDAVYVRETRRLNEDVCQYRLVSATRLDRYATEAFHAWRESVEKGDGSLRKTEVQEPAPPPAGGEAVRPGMMTVRSESVQTYNRHQGNPRHLANAIQAQRALNRMLGLNAPETVLVPTTTGQPTVELESPAARKERLLRLPPEQRAQLRALLKATGDDAADLG